MTALAVDQPKLSYDSAWLPILSDRSVAAQENRVLPIACKDRDVMARLRRYRTQRIDVHVRPVRIDREADVPHSEQKALSECFADWFQEASVLLVVFSWLDLAVDACKDGRPAGTFITKLFWRSGTHEAGTSLVAICWSAAFVLFFASVDIRSLRVSWQARILLWLLVLSVVGIACRAELRLALRSLTGYTWF